MDPIAPILPEVSVARLHLRPGDVLLVQAKTVLSSAQAAHLKARMEGVIGPDNPVLVVDSMVDVSTIVLGQYGTTLTSEAA